MIHSSLFFHSFFFAGLLTLAASCTDQQSPEKKSGALETEQSAGGKTIFFDDFSGSSLDRSKWNVLTGEHYNNEQQAYVDSSLVITLVQGDEAEGASNGALRLRPVFSPGFKDLDGKTYDFISGRIHSKGKFDFQFGTAAARIKLTKGSGLWPAWWLLGNGDWPHTGEIDIMEYVGEPDWVGPAVHGPGYSGGNPFVNKAYFPTGQDVTGWHVYAVEWKPDSILFKYDDQLVFRVTRTMVEQKANWVFNESKHHLLLNFAVGGVFPVQLNGVTQPYFGLPESTLDLIKKQESQMLVDWVRVTQPE